MRQAKIKYNSYTKIPYPIDTDIFNYINDTENIKTFRIFFNAQNITDDRKGWTYFKEYILFLDKLINTIDGAFKVELITTNEQTHTKELGSLKNISLISFGWASNDESLAKLYQKANLMVCTSVEDLSPLMVNEALLCGVPVFGFDNASNREYIFETINGAIFKFGDVQAMAEKTIRYVQNRNLLKDKLTIRNSVIQIHHRETWYKNYFVKILND
jgi:glycosyltransferase involved in cell wall biosynthesis